MLLFSLSLSLPLSQKNKLIKKQQKELVQHGHRPIRIDIGYKKTVRPHQCAPYMQRLSEENHAVLTPNLFCLPWSQEGQGTRLLKEGRIAKITLLSDPGTRWCRHRGPSYSDQRKQANEKLLTPEAGVAGQSSKLSQQALKPRSLGAAGARLEQAEAVSHQETVTGNTQGVS